MDTKKDLKYYINLEWSYTIEQSSANGKKIFILKVNELPGVCTDAKTVEAGMKDLKKIIKATI